MATGPDPAEHAPIPAAPGLGFLHPLVGDRKNIEIGEYTYFDGEEDASRFFDENILYHYDFTGDRLRIGRFCMIARGVRFIMNGATHAMDGFSTFPFNVFGNGWEEGFDPATWEAVSRGDTVVGHDVWFGRDVTVMPGGDIGSGAIIAACSVVTKPVPPYCIVAGNPARIVRRRFDDTVVETLLDIAWWHWDVEKITRNLHAIRGADLEALRMAT